jgi:hypothetical protein
LLGFVCVNDEFSIEFKDKILDCIKRINKLDNDYFLTSWFDSLDEKDEQIEFIADIFNIIVEKEAYFSSDFYKIVEQIYDSGLREKAIEICKSGFNKGHREFEELFSKFKKK